MAERMMLGHNGGPAIEVEQMAAVETVLGDDHETVFRYAQWHIGDYIVGTNGMALEIEGAYIRFLMRLYARGKPLPDDDSFMSTLMGLSRRVWRRVRDALVSFGKIISRNGCLTNSRFEKERARRAEEMKKKAEAANKRWKEKRAAEAVSAKLPANLDETSPKLFANSGEKANKINDAPVQVHMLTNNHYPLKEKDSVPSGTGTPVPSPKSLREVVWDEAIGWLRPQAMTNEARLRTRIGGWMRDYGEANVLDAIAKAQDKRPVSPMSYIEGILRKSGAKPPSFEVAASDELERRRKMNAALEKFSNG